MRYSFEARLEACKNRQNIIDVNVSHAIEAIEAMVDHTIDKGYFDFSINLSEFLQDFDTEIKEEIANYISMYGYNVKWNGSTITVSFEEG